MTETRSVTLKKLKWTLLLALGLYDWITGPLHDHHLASFNGVLPNTLDAKPSDIVFVSTLCSNLRTHWRSLYTHRQKSIPSQFQRAIHQLFKENFGSLEFAWTFCNTATLTWLRIAKSHHPSLNQFLESCLRS
jgi:hypothetical protein